MSNSSHYIIHDVHTASQMIEGAQGTNTASPSPISEEQFRLHRDNVTRLQHEVGSMLDTFASYADPCLYPVYNIYNSLDGILCRVQDKIQRYQQSPSASGFEVPQTFGDASRWSHGDSLELAKALNTGHNETAHRIAHIVNDIGNLFQAAETQHQLHTLNLLRKEVSHVTSKFEDEDARWSRAVIERNCHGAAASNMVDQSEEVAEAREMAEAYEEAWGEIVIESREALGQLRRNLTELKRAVQSLKV